MGQAQSAQAPPPPPVSRTMPTDHPPVPSSSSSIPAECPMHQGSTSTPSTDINALNQMPANLSQAPAPGQALALPVDRTESSIPRSPSPTGEAPPAPKWEYPSPQQFYNALVRKGWETPEEHVETMVHIHNFLNEMAWKEVLKWEAERDE